MANANQDLNLTIAHVVGQGVVALSAGCEIHMAVNPQPGGQSFDGGCWVRHPAGDLSDSMRRSIAVAGGLASLAFERGAPEEIEPVDAFDKLQAGAIRMSPADAEMAEGFTFADVTFALDVLCDRWPIITDEVARMSPVILSNIHRLH